MKLNPQKQKIFNSLNNRQKDVFLHNLEKKPIYSVLHGAVRSGKSYLNNIFWLLHVASFRNENKDFIMSGYTIPALYKNVIKDLENIVGDRITLDKNNSFRLFGNNIRCFGTDKIDSYKAARGFTSYGHYGNEVNLSHKNSIDEFINRCSGRGTRFFWDCNPDNPNHYINTDYIKKSGEKMDDGTLLYSEYHFKLIDNTGLPKSYVQSMLNMPDGMRKNRAVWGLWVASEGVIYTNFIPSQHRIEKPKYDIVETWGGVDWGFDHNGVIVVVGKDYDGNVYFLEEISAQRKHIEWWIERKKEMKNKWNCSTWYCDSARPDYIEKFNGNPANKAVIEGIDYVDSLMTNNKFYQACSAKLFEKEIVSYKWKENTIKEEPEKKDDDCMDALRYALYTHSLSSNIFHSEASNDTNVFLESAEEFF